MTSVPHENHAACTRVSNSCVGLSEARTWKSFRQEVCKRLRESEPEWEPESESECPEHNHIRTTNTLPTVTV